MKKITTGIQGLLHGGLFFLIVELYGAWIHFRAGYYLYNVDGSPVTQWQRLANGAFYQGTFVVVFLLAFLAEINYNLFFRTKKYRQYFMVLIAGAIFTEMALYGWKSLVNESTPVWSSARIFFLSLYVFVYALIRDFIQKQILKKNRNLQQKEAEITALKAQVNPHFFFNTLNTIYGTALLENAPRTATCIEQLSGIMRYTITGAGRDLTPLWEEVNFIEDYLHLQRLRIPDRENIEVKTDISIDNPTVKIAPLLLLPFIENAFKYGISTEHPCIVKIQLNVKDKVLHFLAENTRFPEKNKPEGLGTGIENVRQRLELIYPGRHQLVYEPQENNFIVTLTLDLH